MLRCLQLDGSFEIPHHHCVAFGESICNAHQLLFLHRFLLILFTDKFVVIVVIEKNAETQAREVLRTSYAKFEDAHPRLPKLRGKSRRFVNEIGVMRPVYSTSA
jgi:K+-transporting ATPase A subunit